MPWAVNRSSAPKSLRRQKLFQLEGPDLQGNVVAASARPLSLLLWVSRGPGRGRLGLVLSILVRVRS